MFQQSLVPDYFLEQMFSDMAVHCTKWVVQKVHIGIIVYCPGKRDPLFLSTANVDSLRKSH